MSSARRFPLAAVLRLREQMETAEERALAARVREVADAGDRLRVAQEALEAHRHRRAASVGTVNSATELQMDAARWALLQKAKSAADEALALAVQQKEAQQERFLTVRRARETLSELYENHEIRWQKQQAIGEQKRLDDLFLARTRRPA